MVSRGRLVTWFLLIIVHCVQCKVSSTEVSDEVKIDSMWLRDDIDGHGIHA